MYLTWSDVDPPAKCRVWPQGEDMPTEDAVRNSLKDTLRDMQLDYLDLYYMPADRFNTLKVRPGSGPGHHRRPWYSCEWTAPIWSLSLPWESTRACSGC